MSAGGPLYERARELLASGGRGALVTLIAGPGKAGAKLFVGADGAREGTLGDPALDAAAAADAEELMWAGRSETRDHGERRVFIQVLAPPPHLIVFGAVDVAAALCRLAKEMGFRVTVVDPRHRFATPERFPRADRIVKAWPEEAIAAIGGIGRGDAVVVLTHDPKLDDPAVIGALASEAAYIGVMGSRSAQADRRERLLEQGVAEEGLGRLSAPTGLDLGGIEAEETALSVLSEIVAVRRGREGGRLREASGRIHDVGDPGVAEPA